MNTTFALLSEGGHVSFNHSQLPSDLPLHTGFRGCIYDVVFRSRDHDFNNHWVPTVQLGRGVRQCSIPSCRLRMQNTTGPHEGGDNSSDDSNAPVNRIDDDC